MKKKVIITLITVCTMLFAFGMINASAETSGTCGDNLTWALNDEGTLTVSGIGDMYNWSNKRYVPWYSYVNKIKKVVIEDGVTSIGDDAFLDCSKMESVTFGKNLTSVGSYAFGNCSSLKTNIIFGDSVTHIKQGAFSSCTSINSITIGENVGIIENGAFTKCTSLVEINWNAKKVADFSPNTNNVFNRAGQEQEGITLIFGDNVESIPAYAFYPGLNDANIINIKLGKKVKNIGFDAFKSTSFYKESTNWESGILYIDDCLIGVDSEVSELDINANLQCVAEGVFGQATSLKILHIKSVSKWCELNPPIDKYGDYSLSGVKKIFYDGDSVTTKITLDDTVTKISDYAFYNCTELQTVTMSDSVKSVGDYSFFGCTDLIRVKMSNVITTIGDYAFYGCSSMLEFTMPQKVKTIGESAFEDCSSLTNISVPSTVLCVGNSAFESCAKLSNVYIYDIESWCNIDFSNYSASPLHNGGQLYVNDVLIDAIIIPATITEIKPYAFIGAKNIQSVIIPEGIVKIGDSAFEDCTGLLSISIPSTLKTIEVDAFNAYIRNAIVNVHITDLEAWCNIEFEDAQANPFYIADNLYLNGELVTDLVIPDTVTSIKANQFRDAFCLKSVTLHDKVETIEDYAFNECLNLKYVVIPEAVFYIKNDAFRYCNNLQYVFYKGSQTLWDDMLIYSGNDPLNNATVICNAKEKIYKFETNCDSKLSDITTYCITDAPKPYNEKQVLIGWYDNATLSGDAIVFPYYGDATTLYAAWSERTSTSFDDAFIAKVNQEYTVITTENGQYVYFEFVPNFSKEYRFCTTGNLDTYGYLYDSNKSQLTSDDDDGDGNNFYISYNLTAGETYYIATKLYSGTGTFTFVIEESVDYRINEITIKDMSGNSLVSIPIGTFLATVSFTNVSSSADTVIILAQYTDTGAFRGLMYIQTEDVPTGSTIKLSIPVDNSNGDVARLKAFCWESFGSLTPMGNSASFPVE